MSTSLQDCVVSFAGSLKKTNYEWSTLVREHGGQVTHGITDKVRTDHRRAIELTTIANALN